MPAVLIGQLYKEAVQVIDEILQHHVKTVTVFSKITGQPHLPMFNVVFGIWSGGAGFWAFDF